MKTDLFSCNIARDLFKLLDAWDMLVYETVEATGKAYPIASATGRQ